MLILKFWNMVQMGMKEENDDVTVKTRNLSLELLQVISCIPIVLFSY